MRITGMTVCVNYSDLLARGIDRWRAGLDRLIVVTTPGDTATRALAARHGAEVYTTDAFTALGAAFNKGAALVEAVHATHMLGQKSDWALFFDSDIVPGPDWRADLERLRPTPGNLYGTRRYQVGEQDPLIVAPRRLMPQGWVIGFFMLFHAADPRACPPGSTLFDTCWGHAGNYDTHFADRWQRGDIRATYRPGMTATGLQVILPLPMIHMGEERTHWHGRGNIDAMKAMREERAKRGGTWQHERLRPDQANTGERE